MAQFADQILLNLAKERPDANFAWAPSSAPPRPCPIHGKPKRNTGDLLLDRAWWTITEVQRTIDAATETKVRTALRALIAKGMVEDWEPEPAELAECKCPGPEHIEGTKPEPHNGRTATRRYRLTPAGCAAVLARVDDTVAFGNR